MYFSFHRDRFHFANLKYLSIISFFIINRVYSTLPINFNSKFRFSLLIRGIYFTLFSFFYIVSPTGSNSSEWLYGRINFLLGVILINNNYFSSNPPWPKRWIPGGKSVRFLKTKRLNRPRITFFKPRFFQFFIRFYQLWWFIRWFIAFKTAESMFQDFSATMYLTSLESILTAQRDAFLGNKPTQQSQQVNRAVSFHALKDHAIEILYSDNDTNSIIKPLDKLFLINPTSVRKNRQVPRKKRSVRQWLHYAKRRCKIGF